jgi:hypothetical protein|tara:strand:- start:2360 stop:3055 length:696 start_codon:yes stop_codon:yes gene_type:complete
MHTVNNLNNFIEENNYKANLSLPSGLKKGNEVRLYKGIPFLPIDIKADNVNWDELVDEAKQFDKHYIPHRHHEKHKDWASVVLHGISSIHTEAPEVYGYTNDTAPWRWTDISDFCPNTIRMLKNCFSYKKYFRIRIMRISPGGHIWPHIDGGFDHLGPINVALNNPEGCAFYMGGVGILPFKQGTAISLNIGSKMHSVVNNSNENRYHLIIHGIMDDEMYDIYLRSYQKCI